MQENRRANIFEKSDERILGDSDFLEQVFSAAQEQIEYRHRLASEGYNLDKIAPGFVIYCTLSLLRYGQPVRSLNELRQEGNSSIKRGKVPGFPPARE